MTALAVGQITIDGDMSDWQPGMQVDVLPNPVEVTDDYTAAPELDIEDIWITNDADFLYISISINENGIFDDLSENGGMLSTHEIFLDTDMDSGTGLTWGWWATGADYWILLNVPHGIGWVEGWSGDGGWQEEIGIAHFIGANGVDSNWEDTFAGCDMAINDDDNRLEIAIPREAIGETGAVETTRLMFYGENTLDWSADVFPNDLSVETLVYAYNNPIMVDGDGSDWAPEYQFDVEPNALEEAGDMASYPELDITDVFITHDFDNLYFNIFFDGDLSTIDLGSELIELYLDTDNSAGTGLTWGWWATGGDYYMPLTGEDHGVLMYTGPDGSTPSWEATGQAGVVEFDLVNGSIELSVPRDAIGETALFETTSFFIYAAEMVTWGGDFYPNDLGGTVVTYQYGYGEAPEPPPVPEGLITVDGDAGEWLGEWQLDMAPNPDELVGDYADYPNLDIEDVFTYHDDEWLYFVVDMDDAGSLNNLDAGQSLSIYLDVDQSNVTGITWGTWAAGGDYMIDLTGGGSMMHYMGTGADWLWEGTGYSSWVAFNPVGNVVEVAMPRAAFPDLGNAVNVIVNAQNNEASGWTNDSYPSDLDTEIATYVLVPEGFHVDGNLGEWTTDMLLDVYPNPLEGADYDNWDLDLLDIFGASDEENLYFRVDINPSGMLSNLGAGQSIVLYLDTDQSNGTGLTWGWYASGADYMITLSGAWHAIYEHLGPTGGDYNWGDTGVMASVAQAGETALEVGVPIAALGLGRTDIDFFVGGHNSDWTADTYPNDLSSEIATFSFGPECSHGGDVNLDDAVDVLDVVAVVAHILQTNLLEGECPLAEGDINEDGSIDILDVVSIVDVILNSRQVNAGSAALIQAGNAMSFSADGFVGGFQIEVTHEAGTEFTMTTNAMVAEYHTVGTVTTMLIVAPESNDLFQASAGFEIVNVVAANSDGYIQIVETMPEAYQLGNAYPNPFNPSTSIDYSLTNAGHVQISVYDMTGREVAELVNGPKEAGYYSAVWNAAGNASGLYFIRMTAGNYSSMTKVMLVK